MIGSRFSIMCLEKKLQILQDEQLQATTKGHSFCAEVPKGGARSEASNALRR